MFDISIIDSLTHPTLNGRWLRPEDLNIAGIEQLLLQMKVNNISHSICAGLTGVGGYNEGRFIKMLAPHSDKLIPVAFFDLNNNFSLNEVTSLLIKVKKDGYKGIKIHPRISDIKLDNPQVSSVIKKANELHLSVLLCTYFYDITKNSAINTIDKLSELLYNIDGAEILLMHGGTVRLLETIEIARSYKNVLLDLSFTLIKYKGSSLDLDIKYAFETFDKRICIGSDFPEFSQYNLRERFNFFSKDIPRDKIENIAFRNISQFLKI